MKYLFPLLTIFLQISDLLGAVEDGSPYCNYNKTTMVYHKVNKTREVQQRRPWYKKLSKPSTVIEYYEEEELEPVVIIEHGCCEGYNMSSLRLCEPICSEGCPENSQCVEPEVCQCKMGYFSMLSEHNRKHYCEPICSESCPEHGMCVAPNVCACRAGYKLSKDKLCVPQCPSGCPNGGHCIGPNHCQCAMGYFAENGSCVPHCTAEHGCKNGICIAENLCLCEFGYSKNVKTSECEPTWQESESDFVSTEISTEETTEIIFYQDLSTFKTDEDAISSEYTESPLNGVAVIVGADGSYKCPNDFVLYRGQCKPLKFALDEIDCRLEPCTDVHSHCTESGTCACNSGFRWFRKATPSESEESPHQVVKPICITLDEYKAATQLPQDPKGVDNHLNAVDNDNAKETEDSSNVAAIFFIVLGVVVLACALAFLGVRLLRSNRGQVDVEGRQLACAYDSRAAVDSEKTVT